MSQRPLRSELVDEVPYASPDDVLKHIRNRDEFSDPGRSEAISMLMDRSDFADDRTNRAWRRRRVESWDVPVKLSHSQGSARHRRRSRTATGRRNRDPTKVADPFAPAQLPHLHIAEVEEILLIKGNKVEDITSDGTATVAGGDDLGETAWYLMPERGRIQIDLSELTRIGVSPAHAGIIEDTIVRVSYTYGNNEETPATEAASGNINRTTDPSTDDEGVSESVPGAIRDAVGKLVASDIARMDDLGDMFRQSGGGDLDLTEAADSLREDAMESLNKHRKQA